MSHSEKKNKLHLTSLSLLRVCAWVSQVGADHYITQATVATVVQFSEVWLCLTEWPVRFLCGLHFAYLIIFLSDLFICLKYCGFILQCFVVLFPNSPVFSFFSYNASQATYFCAKSHGVCESSNWAQPVFDSHSVFCDRNRTETDTVLSSSTEFVLLLLWLQPLFQCTF